MPYIDLFLTVPPQKCLPVLSKPHKNYGLVSDCCGDMIDRTGRCQGCRKPAEPYTEPCSECEETGKVTGQLLFRETYLNPEEWDVETCDHCDGEGRIPMKSSQFNK